MKKLLPGFLLIFYTGLLSAQSPVVTEANYPKAGETYSGVYSLGTSFNTGPSGANKSWDFSSISGSSGSIAYENPATTAQGSSFPTSNVTLGYLGNYIYYNISSSKSEIVGAYYNSTAYSYTDPQTILKFPMQFQDEFKDSARTALFTSGSKKQNRTTYSETKADAYGSIKVGSQTYNNVLRVRIVSESIDSTFSAANVFESRNTVIDSQYYWIAPDKKPHVFSALKHVDYSLNPLFQTIVINQYFDAVVATNVNKSISSFVSIYPNPASNLLIVDLKENTVASSQLNLSLVSSEGKEVLNETLNATSNRIQLQKVKSGLYIYHLKKGDEILESGKITIQ